MIEITVNDRLGKKVRVKCKLKNFSTLNKKNFFSRQCYRQNWRS